MYEPENVLPLNDRYRVAIYRNELMFESPLDNNPEVGCWTIRVARGLNGMFSGDADLLKSLTELGKNTEASDYANLQNEVVDYLEREHGMVVMPLSLQGYSQGEWMDSVLWIHPDAIVGDGEQAARVVLEHVAEDLGCYFRGDVYTLVLEELITYTAPNGKTIDRWEPVDGVYASNGNYFSKRPDADELIDRLDFDPADYGVESGEVKKLELIL